MGTSTLPVREANNNYRKWVRLSTINVDSDHPRCHIVDLSRERTAGLVRITYHVSRFDHRWIVKVSALSHHPDALYGYFYMVEVS